ncbi:MAG: group III truncated hemoglobin [Bacteroidota bacterium]
MTNGKSDLGTRQDIEVMVNSFYKKVNQDPLLSPVFNDVSRVDWDQHLPKMYKFWDSLIFGQATYKGNPFVVHVPLPIDFEHFDRWLELFNQNMDELFSGKVAEHTKQRASSIAYIFQTKLTYIRNPEATHSLGPTKS